MHCTSQLRTVCKVTAASKHNIQFLGDHHSMCDSISDSQVLRSVVIPQPQGLIFFSVIFDCQIGFTCKALPSLNHDGTLMQYQTLRWFSGSWQCICKVYRNCAIRGDTLKDLVTNEVTVFKRCFSWPAWHCFARLSDDCQDHCRFWFSVTVSFKHNLSFLGWLSALWDCQMIACITMVPDYQATVFKCDFSFPGWLSLSDCQTIV